jgi:hypothetical protein
MQNTVSQLSLANVMGRVLLATGILLIMASPAYAGSIKDKAMDKATESTITKVATAESLDTLIPIPARARSLTARQIGDTIIIEAAKPVDTAVAPQNTNLQAAANLPSKAASHPVVASEKSSATRVIRTKEVVVMNATPQE